MSTYRGQEVTQQALEVQTAEQSHAEGAPPFWDTARDLGLKLAEGEGAAEEYGRRIALALNRRRADLGYTVADVARKAELAHMTVKNVLLGSTSSKCDHRTFVQLCLALGVLPSVVWEEILTSPPE
jgi:lambda repressor-like predicted transcriptional regulator